MRRINFLVLLLVFSFILSGFTFFKKAPIPVNGVYDLKNKTLTYFDLVSNDIELYANLAELTDSKPDDLTVEIADLDKLVDPLFGRFLFGNNNKKIWFLMGKDTKGFWSEFYIDQNLDYKINTKEKIKTFQTTKTENHGFKIAEAFTLIPASFKVSYKGISKTFEKNLYFFIFTAIYTKNKAEETVVKAVTASFFDGQMKVKIGKEENLVKFRILDFNGNGCYNDYNKDLIYMDLNNDGFFTKKECQTIQEFYSFTDLNKEKRQLHMIILPWPGKFAVIEGSQDFNLLELEPVMEEETAVKTDQNKDSGNTGENSSEDNSNEDDIDV